MRIVMGLTILALVSCPLFGVTAALDEEPPELLLTNEPFDRQHVEQLMKRLLHCIVDWLEDTF